MQGVITALITPFTESNAIDFCALGDLVDQQLQHAPSALLVLGSTGEAHALSASEKDEVVRFCKQKTAHTNTALMVGAGSANTQMTLEACEHYAKLGADLFLIVCPYYVRPTQEGLHAHFTAIADASPRPIMLYNVPSRTGVDMMVTTAVDLCRHQNIIGIKEATGDVERIAPLVATGKAVFSGDDGSAIWAIAQGASGVISVASNWVTSLMIELCERGKSGDEASMMNWLNAHQDLFQSLGGQWPNPVPIKMFLSRSGVIKPIFRLPLTGISEDEFLEQLEEKYQKYAQ